MRQHKASRLKYLNEKIAILLYYVDNGHDLKAARATHKSVGAEGVQRFPTITQAEKFNKSIPREHREAYNKDVYRDLQAASDKLERERHALRTDPRAKPRTVV